MGKFKVISLFSGAMGLDLGLDATDRYEIVACVEKEAAFCNTIRLNRGAGRLPSDLRVYEGDINEIAPSDILRDCGLTPGDVDLLVGGPPCQSFSTAGRRGTVQDPRGTLIWRFLQFVEEMQPKFFLMENVRGLISAALSHRPLAERPDKGGQPLAPDERPGSVIRLLANDLQACGSVAYHMDAFEVNAVNYGAPQLRERVIFIGNRFNRRTEFPDPTHGPPGSSLRPWRTLRDAIGGLNDPGSVTMDFSPRKKRYLSMVPEGSNWRSLPKELQQESMGRAWHAKGGRSGWWRRLSFDLPCPTLVTMPNHASTSLCHPREVRALSLREYALIQEFPTDWEFSGTPAQQYAQVGNAVPVRLGAIAGRVIADALDQTAAHDWRPSRNRIEAYRLVNVHSHVRTRQWYKAGETKVWRDGAKNDATRYAQASPSRRVRPLMERT